MENKKEFNNKNIIVATGPKQLILALGEELTNIGYRKGTINTFNDNLLLVTYHPGKYEIFSTLTRETVSTQSGIAKHDNLNLPKDWDRALQLAKETLEDDKEIKVGDYVRSTRYFLGGFEVGEIARVAKIRDSGDCRLCFDKYKVDYTQDGYNGHPIKGFVKATEQEYLDWHIKQSGLKVGDVLSEDLLDKWDRLGNLYSSEFGWNYDGEELIDDREIEMFLVKHGKACAKISIASDNVVLSIEGIGEFIKEYQKEETEQEKLRIDSYIPEVKEKGVVNYGCQKFTTTHLNAYKRLLQTPGIEPIKIHGKEITTELLDKLIKMIDNGK